MIATTSTNESNLLEKVKEIEEILSARDCDLWRLREAALTDGGLVNDDIRKIAWPRLMGLNDEMDSSTNDIGASRLSASTNHLRRNGPQSGRSSPCSVAEGAGCSSAETDANHLSNAPYMNDLEQIEHDVCRCTYHLMPGEHRAQKIQKFRRRDERFSRRVRFEQCRLANLINLTLLKSYPDSKLRYYQGYHDVASIFLSTLSEGLHTRDIESEDSSFSPTLATKGLTFPAITLLRASQSHLRDALRPDFTQLQTCLGLTLFPLLALMDPEIEGHLTASDMDPLFALSWTITWFAHDIQDSDFVKRLFDAFLVSHPLMPIYLSVAMVTNAFNRQIILGTEGTFTRMLEVIRSLPKNSVEPVLDIGHETDDQRVHKAEFFVDYVEINNGLATVAQEDTTSVSSTEDCCYPDQHTAMPAVPIQTLIDGAVRIMDKVPPSDLVALARRYHGTDRVDEMLKKAPEMTMLGSPLPWTIAGYLSADPISEYDMALAPGSEDEETISRFLEENADRVAVIAAGFGLGDSYRKRRRAAAKRRFRRFVLACLLVVGVACIVRQFAMFGGKRTTSLSTEL